MTTIKAANSNKVYKPEVAMGRFGRIPGEKRKTVGVVRA